MSSLRERRAVRRGASRSGGASAAASRWVEVDRGDRRDVWLSVTPEGIEDPSAAIGAVRGEAARALQSLGAAGAVWERLFLARPVDRPAVEPASLSGSPASWVVVQPPCSGRPCELQVHAVIPAPAGGVAVHAAESSGNGAVGPRSVVLEGRGWREVHLGGLGGPAGGSFEDEARGMFAAAEAELAARGMALHDVARTWIHLADIGRDYAALNRVRRDLFVRRGISPPPASTGIGGSPLLPVAGAPASSRSARCSLALHAVSFTGGARFTPLRSPSLNEAPLYGSDFSRGMRLPIPGGELLHISGTAAVDERGLTVAPGDLRAQVERTLLNVRLLLEGAGAGLGDVVAAVTYLKDRSALDSCLALLEPLGLLEAPHAIVEAEICRPELLIEVEAIAVR